MGEIFLQEISNHHFSNCRLENVQPNNAYTDSDNQTYQDKQLCSWTFFHFFLHYLKLLYDICYYKTRNSWNYGFWRQNPMLAKHIDKIWGTFLTEGAPMRPCVRSSHRWARCPLFTEDKVNFDTAKPLEQLKHFIANSPRRSPVLPTTSSRLVRRVFFLSIVHIYTLVLPAKITTQ